MTEAELREHRASQRGADKAAAEAAADKEAWALNSELAIEVVDRRAAISDRGAVRALIAEMVALRITGHTIKEIAEATGSPPDTVRRYLARAAEIAERNDAAMLVDYHAVPLAVDNLIQGLKDGDKTYTLKTLEGRGILAKHTKGATTSNHSGAFTFAWTGAPQTMPQLPEGSITGIPRGGSVVDAEVIEDDK